MEKIKDLLDRLTSLSEGEIAELEGLILSEFETVEKEEPAPDIIDQMTSLADALDSVRGETSRRVQEQRELSKRAQEVTSRVHAATANEEGTEAEGEEEEETSPPPTEAQAAPVEEEEEDTAPPPPPPAESEAPAPAPEEGEEEDEDEKNESMSAESPDEAEAAVEPEPEPEPENEDEDEGTYQSTTEGETEASVTAAADTPTPEAKITPPENRLPTKKSTVVTTITAGADIPGITAGTEMADKDAIAAAFVKRLHTLRRVTGGDGEQHIVASIETRVPEDRILKAGDAEGNVAKIQSVVSPEAITAAGGFCAPLETRYDVFGLGATDRPVKSALAGFQADRGGLRWTAAPKLADGYESGITIWSDADDQAADPASAATQKPVLVIACGSEQTAVIDAVTLQLQFGNVHERAHPEMIKAHNELALVQHARTAEQNLLDQIKAAGWNVTASQSLGAARDWLRQVERAAVGYRYRNRLSNNFPLRVIAPEWLQSMLRSDITAQATGDGLESLAVADAQINAWLRARNINASWAMESASDAGVDFSQGDAALTDYPSDVEWDLFAEGTFLVLDGGTLDLGIVRDSSLVATNDYLSFVEVFEAVAMVGVESVHVTSTIDDSGLAADCATAP